MARDDKGTAEFERGDHVAWNTSQGETTGVVKQRLTERTTIRDHEVAASPGNPGYLVVFRQDRSGGGAQAGRAPEGRKIEGSQHVFITPP